MLERMKQTAHEFCADYLRIEMKHLWFGAKKPQNSSEVDLLCTKYICPSLIQSLCDVVCEAPEVNTISALRIAIWLDQMPRNAFARELCSNAFVAKMDSVALQFATLAASGLTSETATQFDELHLLFLSLVFRHNKQFDKSRGIIQKYCDSSHDLVKKFLAETSKKESQCLSMDNPPG